MDVLQLLFYKNSCISSIDFLQQKSLFCLQPSFDAFKKLSLRRHIVTCLIWNWTALCKYNLFDSVRIINVCVIYVYNEYYFDPPPLFISPKLFLEFLLSFKIKCRRYQGLGSHRDIALDPQPLFRKSFLSLRHLCFYFIYFFNHSLVILWTFPNCGYRRMLIEVHVREDASVQRLEHAKQAGNCMTM